MANVTLKVCHMTSAHGQEDTRIFHKECVSLRTLGYDVYLVSKGKTYNKDGVHIVGVENPGDGRIKRMLFSTKSVYKAALAIDADIYHAHDPELLPILLKLKKQGKKTVFDSHEHTVGAISEKEYIPRWLRPFVQWAYESYQTYVCKKMDAVVTATPNVTAYFKAKGCNLVIDLCNFPILKSFHEPNYAARTVSFAGGINKQWNHEAVISAIDEIPDCQYLLCGFSSEDYLNRLRCLHGWSRVQFCGRVSHENVADILRQSSVGVSLLTPGANTDWENGNLANTKIFEEMMAALPVVCTDFIRWRDFINQWDCGICVNPSNENEIKNAISELINDPEKARRMGLNGRLAVETAFNWATEEKKLEKLYDRLSEV